MKRLLFLPLLLLGAVSVSLIGGHAAHAVTGGQWQAGHIIDDGVFTNSGALDVNQIQAILNAKVGGCDTNGTQTSELGGGTRAQYGAAHGNPPPYTCINNYYENPSNHQNNLDGRGVPAGAWSAAQIIAYAAQTYNINPEVLIVLLQKEQGLVTDQWPFDVQYRSATGYGCPDTAACDQNYYGFFNQVTSAAWQFQRYAQNPNSYNFVAGQNNYIQWNPNASCGGSVVNIANQATASLYNYTPYQPNFAALNNLYGSGDSCSSYGNRNFWRYFNDWFGSTYAQPYAAQMTSQLYGSMDPGAKAQVYLAYRNAGAMAWYDDTSLSHAPAGTYPVHLSTSHDINRDSTFVDATWAGNNRPNVNFSAVYESDGTTLAADQHVVQPGEIAKFAFIVDAPNGMAPGNYNEYFQPIVEGTGGMFSDPGTFLTLRVNAKPNVAYSSQSSYATIAPSTQQSSSVSFKNSGNVPLYDDASIGGAPGGNFPLHLATACPTNSSSDFAASSWANNSRPATTFAAVYEADGTTPAANQHVAQPGQIIKFAFTMHTPDNYAAGTYKTCFVPVLEGNSYFPDMGIYTNTTVPTTPAVGYTATPSSVNAVSGEPQSFAVTIKNTGNSTLTSGSYFAAYDANYKDTSWLSDTGIKQVGQSLAPGATSTVSLPILAPSSTPGGNFALQVKDTGNAQLPGSATVVPLNYSPAKFTTGYKGQSSYPSLTYSQTKGAYFMYQNTGNKPWYDDTSVGSAHERNPMPVHLATGAPLNRGSGFSASDWANAARPDYTFTAVYENDGTTLAANQHVVQPGQIAKFNFNVNVANWVQPGTYREYFQPIVEGSSDGAIPNPGTYFDITALQPTYAQKYIGQSAYPTIARGNQTTAYLVFQNSGAAPWYDDTSISQAPSGVGLYPVHLATAHALNRSSIFGSTWSNAQRPNLNFSAVYEADGTTLAANQHVVQPRQIAKLSFALSAPANTAPGTYREYFSLVAEGTSNGLFGDPGVYLDVTVQ